MRFFLADYILCAKQSPTVRAESKHFITTPFEEILIGTHSDKTPRFGRLFVDHFTRKKNLPRKAVSVIFENLFNGEIGCAGL